MHEKGWNPAIAHGSVDALESLSKNLKSEANAVKVSFVSLPIMILKGKQRLQDWALIVKGLSSNCLLDIEQQAALSVT